MENQIKSLKNNGYVIIKNLLDSDFCKQCIDYLKYEFPNPLNMPQTNTPYFYSNFSKNSIIYNILKNEKINEIVHSVLGDNYKLLWFKIFNKIKWIGQDVEYHQEIIYNQNSNIHINDSFQLFISLDKHTKNNGCLKIIPFNDKKILRHDQFIDRHGDHKYRVNSDVLSELYDKNGIIECEFDAGDSVFFFDTIPHGSASNASPNDRYGVAISFIKSNVHIDTVIREKKYMERRIKSKKYLEQLLEKTNDKLKKVPDIFIQKKKI